MSGYADDPRECAATQDELAEFALGIVSGRRRSMVLDHVESCPRCSVELDRLSILADILVQLIPEIEPPLGFELRLAERLREGATAGRRPRFRRVAQFAAAAAAVAVLGFGVVASTSAARDHPSPAASVNVTSASLVSHGHVLGEVMLSPGRPAWLFMTIDEAASSGKVTCEVTLASGEVEKIGVFELSGGYGAWGAPLTSPAGEVRSARLLAPDGRVVASAHLAV